MELHQPQASSAPLEVDEAPPVSVMKVAIVMAMFALLWSGGAADVGFSVAQLDALMEDIIGSIQMQIRCDRKHFQNQIETERKVKGHSREALHQPPT